MTRIRPIDPARATSEARELLDSVQRKLGTVPNMTRAMASSPAVLKAYLEFSGALAGGSLGAKVREQIALTVAETNRCDYCLAAHHAIGARVGLSPGELTGARAAQAEDPRTAAILRLARTIAAQGGELDDAEFRAAREMGLGDGEIAEVIANVSLNVFTNYFNHAARTELDFPAVEKLAPA